MPRDSRDEIKAFVDHLRTGDPAGLRLIGSGGVEFFDFRHPSRLSDERGRRISAKSTASFGRRMLGFDEMEHMLTEGGFRIGDAGASEALHVSMDSDAVLDALLPRMEGSAWGLGRALVKIMRDRGQDPAPHLDRIASMDEDILIEAIATMAGDPRMNLEQALPDRAPTPLR